MSVAPCSRTTGSPSRQSSRPAVSGADRPTHSPQVNTSSAALRTPRSRWERSARRRDAVASDQSARLGVLSVVGLPALIALEPRCLRCGRMSSRDAKECLDCGAPTSAGWAPPPAT